MKSVGEILKTAREKKKLSLEMVSQETAVSLRFLRAIDDDEFELLPNEVSARGFLTLYANAVGMDPKSIIAVYRRDVPSQWGGQTRLKHHFFVFGQQRLFRMVLWTAIAGLAVGLLTFAGLLLVRLRQAPPLVLLSPKNETHVISPVFLQGRTSTDAVIAIDGESIGVNQDGIFSKDIDLDPGLHVLTVKSIGRNGKERSLQLVVTVDEEK